MPSENPLDESTKKHAKMMKCGYGLKVTLRGNYEGISTPGEIRIQHWNKRERMFRALKLGGACWGAALIAIIIPLLHFILVPGFLIAEPIVAFFIFGQESVILGGEGICPKCQAFVPIVRTSLRFPISELCSHCQCGLKIEPLDINPYSEISGSTT